MKATSVSAPEDRGDHLPVLLTVVGRQRTGKTTFLNALAETAALRGGAVETWNTDMLNVTNSISRFHPNTLTPPYAAPADQAIWLEQQITDLLDRPRDVLLDIGGGWTPFHQMITSTSVMPNLKQFGVRMVVAYMFGPDLADADYLADLQKGRAFDGSDSILIFNRGLIPSGASQHTAFEATLASPSVEVAIKAGASYAMMPALSSMPKVLDSGASFSLYAEPRNGAGAAAGNL